jgi:N-acyl amino acid synthase of PEP-CTERM/exosortase system
MDPNKIVASFNKYFRLTLANDHESLNQVYQVRYQVYCEEFNYLKGSDGLEKDEHDDHSQHCLLIHKDTNTPAGCLRLIGSSQDDLATPLPFEKFWFPSRQHLYSPESLPRGSFCECSRLAVTSSFRRRREDEKKPISIPEEMPSDPGQRLNFPLIPVALFLAGIALFLNSKFQFAVAMMEPRLARMLKRYGIVFLQVGEVVDYHGPRAPFVFSREGVLNNLQSEVGPLLELITEQIFAEN